MRKNLHISKKSCNFAPSNKKQTQNPKRNEQNVLHKVLWSNQLDNGNNQP